MSCEHLGSTFGFAAREPSSRPCRDPVSMSDARRSNHVASQIDNDPASMAATPVTDRCRTSRDRIGGPNQATSRNLLRETKQTQYKKKPTATRTLGHPCHLIVSVAQPPRSVPTGIYWSTTRGRRAHMARSFTGNPSTSPKCAYRGVSAKTFPPEIEPGVFPKHVNHSSGTAGPPRCPPALAILPPLSQSINYTIHVTGGPVQTQFSGYECLDPLRFTTAKSHFVRA